MCAHSPHHPFLRTMAVMPAAALFLQDLLPGRQMVGRFLRKLLVQQLARAFDVTFDSATRGVDTEAPMPSVAYVLDGDYDESLCSLACIAVPCLLFLLLLILKYLKRILAKLGEPVVILIRDSCSGSLHKSQVDDDDDDDDYYYYYRTTVS